MLGFQNKIKQMRLTEWPFLCSIQAHRRKYRRPAACAEKDVSNEDKYILGNVNIVVGVGEPASR
jgi:hypothetical protein